MIRPARVPGRRASLTLAALLMLLLPAVVLAHAELETSTPADGATVPSPFAGPIVMTFSAALANGSKAELYGPDGTLIASAMVDGPGATMTIALGTALAAGDYEIKWTTVAEDTDVARGTVEFTVTPAPPSVSPSDPPTAGPTAPAATTPSAATPSAEPASSVPSALPSATPAVGSSTSASGGDVVLPILVALIVIGAGAVYLLSRRNRPAMPR